MIRISKDNDFKEVTRGVYENIFKPLGYKPIIKATKVQVKQPAKPKTDDTLKSKYDVFDEKESSIVKNKRGE